MSIKATYSFIKNLMPKTFVAHLKLTVGMIVIITTVFSIYVWSENQIDKENNLRLKSHELTHELRQSSNNLTRMVRAYVVTGDPRYKKYYQNIIDIRNGKIPRPQNYNQLYWNFILAGEIQSGIDTTRSITLLDLMKQAGFSEHELQKLSASKSHSDKLAELEFKAMALFESSITDSKSNALEMLYDDNYLRAKADIMRPINDVFSLMGERTDIAINRAKIVAFNLRALLIGFVFSLIFILFRLYSLLKGQLGGGLSEVQHEIARIGSADFTSVINVPVDKESSVLGWLAKTQSNLIKLEHERKLAENARRASEQRFRDMVNSTDGIVWEADAITFNFTFISQYAEVILGYPLEDWLEPGFWVKHLHPDDKSWAPEYCASCTGRLEPHNFEYRFIAKDGRTVWLNDVVTVVEEDEKPRWIRGIMVDITERKQAEESLRIAATAFESQEGIMVTDANSNILRVNQAFTKVTGYSAEEVIGQTPRLLSSGKQDKAFYTTMWASINNTGTWEGEIWNRRKNGEIFPEHLTITAVKDARGIVTNYVATLIDITASKAASEKIENLAFYDPLTQLPNRRLLLDRLNQALASSAREGQRGAILFLDLDHFKILNDTLGHGIGDILLQQVGIRLTACVREGDTVSRLGGDEFVILLEGLSKQGIEAASQTKKVAEKILISLNQPYQLNAHTHHGTSSIGAALFNGHEQTTEDLLRQSDIAMYQSKAEGRNTLRFFDPMMQDVINNRADMGKELRKAIEHNQFQLHYQIQVDSNGQALGAEVLIRWLHPERGMISPLNFIPLAEESGLILPIGQWVLDTACAQLKTWQHNPLTQDLVLAVNVSAKQFHQKNFVEQVKTTLQHHESNPRRLKLELTESMLVNNINDIITKMNALSKIGVQFSLDDFGTGYSSLQYLKNLPLNQLKIDQSFVRDIVMNPSDRAIVRTIITMAHGLDINVIAEGVESAEQRQYLLNNDCTSFQGYLFSKPVPIDEFEALLTKADLY